MDPVGVCLKWFGYASIKRDVGVGFSGLGLGQDFLALRHAKSSECAGGGKVWASVGGNVSIGFGGYRWATAGYAYLCDGSVGLDVFNLI